VLSVVCLIASALSQVEAVQEEPAFTEAVRPAPPPPGSYHLVEPNQVDVNDGLTRVRVSSGFPAPVKGFFPLAVLIDNGRGDRQSVDIVYRSASDEEATTVARKSISVEKAERKMVMLSVPVHLTSGQVTVTGATVGSAVPHSVFAAANYQGGYTWLCIGDGEGLAQFLGQPSNEEAETQIGCLSVEQVPTDLAGFSGYAGVLVPQLSNLQSLTTAQQGALQAYVLTGGQVVVPESSELQSFRSRWSWTDEALRRTAFGNVRVHQAGQRYLFERTLRNEDGMGNYQDTVTGTARALLPQAFAPVGFFFLVVLLYVLLIGPGSYWVHRRFGALSLVLAIPAFSLCTCLLLGLYAVLKDGLSTHVSGIGFTLLDEQKHRATTIGASAYYANLRSRGGTFSTATSLSVDEEAPGVQGPRAWSIDWTEGFVAGPQLVPARTYREFTYASVSPTRAHAVVRTSAGEVFFRNALGAQVLRVIVNTGQGFYQGDKIGDGAEERLQKIETSAEFPPNVFEGRLPVKRALTAEPGQFMARLATPRFIEFGFSDLEVEPSIQLVQGTYATP
jgi:hypothetical protein